MASITISREQLDKVMADIETLIEDFSSIVSQDAIARKRLAEVKENPSIGRSEAELDDYLKGRGVEVDRVGS